MRDIFSMWKDTRMVVLTAVTAAIYAAVTMPLKIAPIIPGFTEIRPGVAFVVFCSFLFGPAAAWGAAFGNLIGDFFGTLGLGSVFGFVGNFLFGLIPYKIYRILAKDSRSISSPRDWIAVIIATLSAAAACGFTIGWGVDLLGFVPFHILAGVITVNNAVLAGILVPILLKLLFTRVQQWGLTYQDILPQESCRSTLLRFPGIILLWIGTIGGLTLGLLNGFDIISISTSNSILLAPFMAMTLIGAILL